MKELVVIYYQKHLQERDYKGGKVGLLAIAMKVIIEATLLFAGPAHPFAA